ncbi:hypothetical protein [Staphylococcus cornubiensis]|uniref:hypothetical protein n=1 Tax=Staphylococcus cornubiensis TaxID=1986155 RepID=UPI001356532A|nr:hypothetical protein [Staphylococcus cornubiensis]
MLFSEVLSDEKSLAFEGVDQHTALIINRTIFSITGGFTVLFSMLFFFILSLVVTKILKTKPSAKSLFSGAVLLVLVINTVILIVAIIQFLFGLNPEDYNILSLNIFNAGNHDPNGVHGSGIRFSKSRTDNILYVTNPNGDIGTGDISVRAAEIRDYIRTIGMLEIRQWSDSKAFNQIKVGAVNTTNSVVMASHSGGNAYYGVGGGSNEMRVTNNNGYNGGNTSYKPVRASAFNNASLAEYKKDIKVWDYDALSVIANELELYQYRYKGDTDDQMLHRGVVIGAGYSTPAEFVFGDGVNLYEMLTWSLRSIQQLNEKIKELEEQLNEQTTS